MVQRSLFAIATAVATALSYGACGDCSAESVYLISDGGQVARIDNGFVLGASYVDASQKFTRIAVGNATATGGLQVGVGDSTGGVHVLNGGLASQTGYVDSNGALNDPVTGIAVGSVGDQPHVIAATNLWYNGGTVALANLRGNALIYASSNPASLSQVGASVIATLGGANITYPGGSPNTYVDLTIANLDESANGNELLMGMSQLNPDGTHVAPVVQESGRAQEVQTLGGVNTIARRNTMNNYLAGVAVGDIRAEGESLTPGALDDFLMFGADNGAPLRSNRNSWQAFTRSPGPGAFTFQTFNAGDQSSAIVDAVIGNVFAGAFSTPPDDVTAPDKRNEVISVGKQLSSGAAGATPTGNGVIEIGSTFAGGCCLQQIVIPNEELTSIVLADVVGDDGVLEIIAGGSLGNVHIFQHATPGDLTSLFAVAPFRSMNVLPVGVTGRVVELATEYRGAVVPEPGSLCMVMLLGVVGLATARRQAFGQR